MDAGYPRDARTSFPTRSQITRIPEDYSTKDSAGEDVTRPRSVEHWIPRTVPGDSVPNSPGLHSTPRFALGRSHQYYSFTSSRHTDGLEARPTDLTGIGAKDLIGNGKQFILPSEPEPTLPCEAAPGREDVSRSLWSNKTSPSALPVIEIPDEIETVLRDIAVHRAKRGARSGGAAGRKTHEHAVSETQAFTSLFKRLTLNEEHGSSVSVEIGPHGPDLDDDAAKQDESDEASPYPHIGQTFQARNPPDVAGPSDGDSTTRKKRKRDHNEDGQKETQNDGERRQEEHNHPRGSDAQDDEESAGRGERSNDEQIQQDDADVGKRQQLLPCPYWMHDPHAHHDCSTIKLRDIAYVRQHIKRNHKRPNYYCARCYESFTCNRDREAHDQEGQCSRSNEHPFGDRCDLDQWNDIQKPYRGQHPRDVWIAIYATLFPEEPVPGIQIIGNMRDLGSVAQFLDLFEAFPGIKEIVLYDRFAQGRSWSKLLGHTQVAVDRALGMLSSSAEHTSPLCLMPQSSPIDRTRDRASSLTRPETDCLGVSRGEKERQVQFTSPLFSAVAQGKQPERSELHPCRLPENQSAGFGYHQQLDLQKGHKPGAYTGNASQDFLTTENLPHSESGTAYVPSGPCFPGETALFQNQGSSIAPCDTFYVQHVPQALREITHLQRQQLSNPSIRTRYNDAPEGQNRLSMSQENQVKRAALDKFHETAAEEQNSYPSQSLRHRPTGERKLTAQDNYAYHPVGANALYNAAAAPQHSWPDAAQTDKDVENAQLNSAHQFADESTFMGEWYNFGEDFTT